MSQPAHRSRVRAHGSTPLSGLAARQQFSGTVLVARKGKTLLDKGYGLADRQDRVPNGPNTKYPVGGVNASSSLLAALKLEEQGKLNDRDRVCAYLSSCPQAWEPITVRMVLDGTSGLPNFSWGDVSGTTAQSLARCESEPLTAPPGSTLNYQNCATLVLGTIFEKVTGKPWATVMRQLILGPAQMRQSGRVTDRLSPPGWAREYSGSYPGVGKVYNSDYFSIYSTARDIYAYDTALFKGRLVSRRSLERMLAPRDPVVPADAGINNARSGYIWKIGTVLGHKVIYTAQNAYSFTTANFHLPQDDVTVVVNSNDDRNNVEGIAVHIAGLVLQYHLTTRPLRSTAATTALVGTYRRAFHNSDRVAAHDPGIRDWVGGTITMAIRKNSIHFALMDNLPQDSVDEHYRATRGGQLTLQGYLPANHNSFCSDDPHLVAGRSFSECAANQAVLRRRSPCSSAHAKSVVASARTRTASSRWASTSAHVVSWRRA